MPPMSICVALFALGAFALPASAEKANMTPARKRATATHVVVGVIQATYSREEREGNYQVTHYAAEVGIMEVEKGEGLAPGGLVYARYWTRRWVGAGAMPAGASGHDQPTPGGVYRVYLAQRAYDGAHPAERNADGGFNVLYRDGFEAATAFAPTGLQGATLEVATAGERPAFRWVFGADGALTVSTGSDAALPASLVKRLLGREAATRTITATWVLRGKQLVLSDLAAAELSVAGPVVLSAAPLAEGATVFLAGIEAAIAPK